MAKEDLIPLNQRSPEERREIARAGGIASGKARRRRRELREYMEALLDVPLDNKNKIKKKLEKKGLPEDMLDNKMLLTAALFQRAITGDVQAVKEVRSIIGEIPELQAITDEDNNIQIVIKKAEPKGESND